MNPVYCSIIHGALTLNFKSENLTVQSCCLRNDLKDVTIDNIWNENNFKSLRDLNLTGVWDPGCSNCQSLEKVNLDSFRTGMNHGLNMQSEINLSGPARIDLMFDISCNLACRTCRPTSSTMWQKHLKKNNKWPGEIYTPKNKDQVIEALQTLDLSNLRMLVFCGGETLLGQEYWAVANWLADNVPDAKKNLTICFQTNGTQPILKKNYAIIEKFKLVKLHISLDGTNKRFEYLRWPAQWTQVTENILDMRDNLPGNVMFLVEETISIFNLFYISELELWIKNNFATNRYGDITSHTRHLAKGIFSLNQLTTEYVNTVKAGQYKDLIPSSWKEDPVAIKSMLDTIHLEDSRRNESFAEIFPEVAGFYSKFTSAR
jgi:sulfatase maturation enzyme AslB (radical SAM superfamily)